jgi:hypothetical protein
MMWTHEIQRSRGVLTSGSSTLLHPPVLDHEYYEARLGKGIVRWVYPMTVDDAFADALGRTGRALFPLA